MNFQRNSEKKNSLHFFVIFRKKMQSSRTIDCMLGFRKLGLAKATRCLTLTSLKYANSRKNDQIVPGNLNTYFRIFGFKTESTRAKFGNVLFSHRRRLRRAIATVLFTPLYICKYDYFPRL